MALIIFCLCSCSSQYLVHFWVLCYEDLMWNCIKALLSPCHTHHLDMMDTRILSRPRPGRIISRSSLRIDSPFGLFRGRFLLSSATMSMDLDFQRFAVDRLKDSLLRNGGMRPILYRRVMRGNSGIAFRPANASFLPSPPVDS